MPSRVWNQKVKAYWIRKEGRGCGDREKEGMKVRKYGREERDNQQVEKYFNNVVGGG